jgi:NhaP-type Na+/H+ or K+/H+ antiporter
MEYILLLLGLGLLILLVAWLPMMLKELPLSLPMFCIGFGALAFWLAPLDAPLPTEFPKVTERLTELVVVVALTGAGLKLDRPLGWRSWNITWRLLAIAMPLSILAIAAIGHWVLGLGVAAALLVGAALAPTDPVLAGDVQVGPPGEGEEDDVRFNLTAEAGLNDALAFPFIHLALLFAALGGWPGATEWGEWLAVEVLWKLAAGLGVGWATGKALGWVLFHVPNRAGIARPAKASWRWASPSSPTRWRSSATATASSPCSSRRSPCATASGATNTTSGCTNSPTRSSGC